MAEIDEGLDISTLPYDEAIKATVELLGMTEDQAVLYVWIVQGIVEGDTY